jgi:hypothetical protein
MKVCMIGLMTMVCMGLLSGCAASAAAEDGVADHKNHAEKYTQSPINNGSEVATKLNPRAASAVSAAPAAPAK